MLNTANRKGDPLHLTQQERQTLQQKTHDAKRSVADRARIVLALDTGLNSLQIAQQTGLHPVSIRRIKHDFQQTRLASLESGKRTGRRPTKRQVVEAFVEQHSQCGRLQNPTEGILSVAALKKKLQEEQQISVCVNTVRAALKKRALATGDLGTA